MTRLMRPACRTRRRRLSGLLFSSALLLTGLASLQAAEQAAQPCAHEDNFSLLSGSALLLAAQQGHAGAQYSLALSYDQGLDEFAQDPHSAAHWYASAAEQGHTCAQYNLAVGYEQGLGLPVDPGLAAYWYQQAAKQGDRDAQYNLALCYQEGRGVERDPHQALYWYRQAARQGDADAQFELGNLYRDGSGLPQDPRQAQHWYRKAARQAHKGAGAALELLAQHSDTSD